jgi:hypothetical protein
MVIGTKFDEFANKYQPVEKKLMCQALRHISHANGCDLVFSSVRENKGSTLYRSLLNYFCFEGGALAKADKNPNNMIHMPAGSDKFSDIGEPDGASQRNLSFDQLWKVLIE